MKFRKYIKKIDEQTYICPECGYSFHSAWKDKDLKCSKCNSIISVKK